MHGDIIDLSKYISVFANLLCSISKTPLIKCSFMVKCYRANTFISHQLIFLFKIFSNWKPMYHPKCRCYLACVYSILTGGSGLQNTDSPECNQAARNVTWVYHNLPPLPRPGHMEAYFVRAPDICTHPINIHEIYGTKCELKCTFGFDWSRFLLTAVTFDWL